MMRAAIVLVLISGPAFAQPPRYDVEAHCDQVAGFGGAYRNDMASFCIGSEQSAYNALKSEWDAVPSGIRVHCGQIATFGSAGSYEMLKFCFDDELSAASTRGTFQY